MFINAMTSCLVKLKGMGLAWVVVGGEGCGGGRGGGDGEGRIMRYTFKFQLLLSNSEVKLYYPQSIFGLLNVLYYIL